MLKHSCRLCHYSVEWKFLKIRKEFSLNEGVYLTIIYLLFRVCSSDACTAVECCENLTENLLPQFPAVVIPSGIRTNHVILVAQPSLAPPQVRMKSFCSQSDEIWNVAASVPSYLRKRARASSSPRADDNFQWPFFRDITYYFKWAHVYAFIGGYLCASAFCHSSLFFRMSVDPFIFEICQLESSK